MFKNTRIKHLDKRIIHPGLCPCLCLLLCILVLTSYIYFCSRRRLLEMCIFLIPCCGDIMKLKLSNYNGKFFRTGYKKIFSHPELSQIVHYNKKSYILKKKLTQSFGDLFTIGLNTWLALKIPLARTRPSCIPREITSQTSCHIFSYVRSQISGHFQPHQCTIAIGVHPPKNCSSLKNHISAPNHRTDMKFFVYDPNTSFGGLILTRLVSKNPKKIEEFFCKISFCIKRPEIAKKKN